jgi:hypothetical protein
LAITAQVRAALPATTPSTPEALAQAALDFYQNANDAQHPIRNMLLRIPLDSPELLGVIQKEGAV